MLVALDDSVAIKTTIFLEVTQDIERLTNRIGQQTEAGVALASARIKAVSERSTLLLGFSAVFALGLGAVASARLGRRIVVPLRRLSQAAHRIGQGESGEILDSACKCNV